MPIKVVAFDLWNTLIYDSSKENHKKIANILGFKDRFEFWDYCESNFFHKKQTFYDFLADLIKKKKLPEGTISKIKDLWEESKNYVNVFPETVPILEKIKKRYKTTLISNSAEEEANSALDKFKIRKYFDRIIISCEIGLAKPDPKIFQLILDHFNVKSDEVIMIGDNFEMDIVPARFLGFKAILIDRRNKYPQYKDEDWYIKSLEELDILGV